MYIVIAGTAALCHQDSMQDCGDLRRALHCAARESCGDYLDSSLRAMMTLENYNKIPARACTRAGSG
jgi:hypothetical protein